MKIKTQKAEYTFIPKLGIVVNSELEQELNCLIPPVIDENSILKKLNRKLSDEELSTHLSTIPHLTLNITEQCNFRCKYCIFSGIYKEPTRKHSSKKMSFSTARKAIDFIINKSLDPCRINKENKIEVTFYGGEPLLEINLIKKIISYAREREKKDGSYGFAFRSNTNGYLLNEEIIDYLVAQDISIDISLDGPKQEHDKFRITREGKNTWERIIRNVNIIKSKSPDYLFSKVHFFVTVHPLHDIKAVEGYFIDNPDLFNIKNVMINFFNPWQLKEEVAEQIQKKTDISKRQVSQLDFEYKSKDYDHKLRFKMLSEITQFTGMCFPGGDKLLVDVNGNFRICERVHIDQFLGDVDNGYDYEMIRNLHYQWNQQIIKNKCWECDFYSICPVCFSQIEDAENIDLVCDFRYRGKERLTDYINHKEAIGKSENPKSLTDYLDQL